MQAHIIENGVVINTVIVPDLTCPGRLRKGRR